VATHKIVIGQVRPGAPDTLDCRCLTGRKPLSRIQATLARQQALLSQYVVNSGNAPSKAVRRVEHHAVRRCDLFREI
jgi:hypothetical protein